MAVGQGVEQPRCVEFLLGLGGYSLMSELSSVSALQAGAMSGYRKTSLQAAVGVSQSRRRGYWGLHPWGTRSGVSP